MSAVVRPIPGRFLRIAHRGASGHAPENSVAACLRALDMRADYVELDVRRTTDGTLIAFHDDTLDRTTSGTGPVSGRSLAQLRSLDAGSWFNAAHPQAADPAFVGTQVATLDEIIAAVGDRAGLYIEAKAAAEQPGIEEDLVAALERAGLIAADRVVLQGFDAQSLFAYRQAAPMVPRVQLLEYATGADGRIRERVDTAPAPAQITREDFARIAEYADGVGPNATAAGRDLVDAEFVAAAHAAGLFVHVWTVDDQALMRRLIAAGVDGIFTNHPDRLAAVLDGGS